MSPYLYGMLTVLVSSAYLEILPSYIYEQDTISSHNGATVLYAVFSISALFTVSITMRTLGHNKSDGNSLRPQPLMGTMPLLSIVFLELFLIAHVFASGSPLLTLTSSKFDFWEVSAKLKALSIFNWLLYLIIFVVGGNGGFFLYEKRKDYFKRFLSILILLLGICYYISWGNKFSALIMMLFMYFVPSCLSYKFIFNKQIRFNIKVIIYGSLLILFFMSLVIWQYSIIQTRGLDIVEQLAERIFVLQGHVWWGIVERVIQKGPIYSHVLDEIQAMVTGTSTPGAVGMTYLMKLLAPPTLFSGYMSSNVQFTAGYPAINVITFGFLFGWLITVLGWFVFALFLNYLCTLMRNGSRIRLFYSAYIYLTFTGWLMHGTPSLFFGPKLMLFILLLFSLETVRYVVNLPKTHRFNVSGKI